MLILGLCDGPRPGAAVVVDQEPPVAAAGECWATAERLLARVGARPDQVDLVAVAGRFTPSRRGRPERSGAIDPFGSGARMDTRGEHLRRATGFGAIEADRATEWFEAELPRRGYHPQRTLLVDRHRCAASTAYRCQPSDDLLVAVVLPRGDGVFASVHRGRSGQLERLYADDGSSPVHLWLDRARAVAGLADRDGSDVLAAGVPPDPGVGALLRQSLRLEGGRFAGRRFERRQGAAWVELGRLPRAVAAATALDVLRARALDWLAAQLPNFPTRELALGGALADDPRIVAGAAELGVERVWAGPWTGGAALAAGAALMLAGSAPALPPSPEVDGAVPPAGLGTVPADPERVAAVLIDGGAVARYGGAEPFGPWGGGWRSVLVRADQRDAIQRARASLRRPEEEQMAVLTESDAPGVDGAERISGPLRFGLVAPRIGGDAVAGVARWDGRAVVGIADPVLAEVLALLRRRTGVGTVVSLPFGWGDAPSVADEAAAVEVWRRASLGALVLGSSLAVSG